MIKPILVISVLSVAACSQEPPPQWCKNTCEDSGGVSRYNQEKPYSYTRCNDAAFFTADTPSKCEQHGGVSAHGVSKTASMCWCEDGSLISGNGSNK